MRKAAAVLVLKGTRVLAFRRYDAEGLSFPCGKVDPGESTDTAAVRECLEETGLEVQLSDMPPFVGFDREGGTLVSTFLAEVTGGSLQREAVGEGWPLWASVREVANGPYAHYNRRALRAFGVRVPLSGKFHSHLTIEPTSEAEAQRAAMLVGGKLTMIDLSRGEKTQTDAMITHHYVTGSRGLEDEGDVLALLRSRAAQLAESGITVLRVKLEHEPLDSHSSADDVVESLSRVYTEIHVKCVVHPDNRENLTRAAALFDWHPSRNPFATREDGQLVQFVNRRFYEKMSLAEVDEAVDAVTDSLTVFADIEEIKYETAVYDSAEDHDRWWMS